MLDIQKIQNVKCNAVTGWDTKIPNSVDKPVQENEPPLRLYDSRVKSKR